MRSAEVEVSGDEVQQAPPIRKENRADNQRRPPAPSSSRDDSTIGDLLVEMRGDAEVWKRFRGRMEAKGRKVPENMLRIISTQMQSTEASIGKMEKLLHERKPTVPRKHWSTTDSESEQRPMKRSRLDSSGLWTSRSSNLESKSTAETDSSHASDSSSTQKKPFFSRVISLVSSLWRTRRVCPEDKEEKEGTEEEKELESSSEKKGNSSDGNSGEENSEEERAKGEEERIEKSVESVENGIDIPTTAECKDSLLGEVENEEEEEEEDEEDGTPSAKSSSEVDEVEVVPLSPADDQEDADAEDGGDSEVEEVDLSILDNDHSFPPIEAENLLDSSSSENESPSPGTKKGVGRLSNATSYNGDSDVPVLVVLDDESDEN